MKNYLIAIVFILGLFACELKPISPVDIEDLPVISGYISPSDTITRISVRKTLPLDTPVDIFKTNITDATVSLNYQGKQVLLSYNPKSQYYEAWGIVLKPKDKVGLTVLLSSGKQAIAETTIPDEVQNIQYKYQGDKSFELSWQHKPNTYFNVIITKSSADNSQGRLEFNRISPQNFYLKSTSNVQSTQSGSYTHGQMNFPEKSYESANLTWGVVSIDSAMYYFNKANKEIFQLSPFQDRTPVYNNIKGGVGIFGSYTITKKTVLLAKSD